MVKLSEVAARAAVSPAVVSRILSGDESLRVSPATRERVIEAVLDLDYAPNHAARALRSARTRTIALVVPEVTSTIFAELTRGAEAEASARGLEILLGRATDPRGDGEWLRRLIGEDRIDGAILQPPDGVDIGDFERLAARGTPVVVINSIDEGPLSTLVLDDAAGIRTAVHHLHSLGHTEIGFLGAVVGSFAGDRREIGFRAAMAEFGLDLNPAWLTHEGFSGAEGRAAAARLLDAGAMPRSLVVANLNAALGALAEIHARGLRVPADTSIVALHDVWYADATWPPVTTVRMPLFELGRAAVARLAEGGPVTHTAVTAPAPELIVRESTASP